MYSREERAPPIVIHLLRSSRGDICYCHSSSGAGAALSGNSPASRFRRNASRSHAGCMQMPARGAIIEIIKRDLASRRGVSRHRSRNSYLAPPLFGA